MLQYFPNVSNAENIASMLLGLDKWISEQLITKPWCCDVEFEKLVVKSFQGLALLQNLLFSATAGFTLFFKKKKNIYMISMLKLSMKFITLPFPFQI